MSLNLDNIKKMFGLPSTDEEFFLIALNVERFKLSLEKLYSIIDPGVIDGWHGYLGTCVEKVPFIFDIRVRTWSNGVFSPTQTRIIVKIENLYLTIAKPEVFGHRDFFLNATKYTHYLSDPT